MATVVPNRYPVDYSGVAPSNLVENEHVTLQSGEFRVFSPLYSPFFKKNIVIVDAASGLTLAPNQFACKCIGATASAIAGAGNEVYSVVVILDEEVGNQLTYSYQTVGGAYTTGYEALAAMISNLLTTNQISNNDPVDFGTVQHLPEGYRQNLHLHALGATAGWEFIASELEKIRHAILLGDQTTKTFVLSYIANALAESQQLREDLAEPGTPFGDHVANVGNPHNLTKAQVDLGNVQNYATATLPQALEGTRDDLYVTASQVAAVVQNVLDLGVDAHILDMNNPHGDDKSTIGLPLLQNYGVAVLADMQTPVSGTPKYVTNLVAAEFLADMFDSLNSENQGIIDGLLAQAATAVSSAQAALAGANTASASVASAAATIAAASTQADQALASSNQNTVNVQNSESAAIQLIQEYAVEAIVLAETQGYSRGFADGQASMA